MQYNLAKTGQIYPWLATSWTFEPGGIALVVKTRAG